MKSELNLVALIMLAAFVVPDAEPQTHIADVDTSPLGSTITEVTVFADRALIKRSGTVRLDLGTARFSISPLPAWLDSGSIRARIEPAGRGEIGEVQIHKEYLAEASDLQLRSAEQSVEEIGDRIAELDDELALLDSRELHVAGLRAFSMDKIPRDVVSREIPVAHYRQIVEFAHDELTEIATKRREIRRLRRTLAPEHEARERRLAELRRLSSLEQHTIVVTVNGIHPGDATLHVSYMLPGATWEPQHEFRFSSGIGQTELATFASITQTTGEDWARATIKLSTQSTVGVVSIPELETLLVGRTRFNRVFDPQIRDSFSVAQSQWATQNEIWNTRNQPDRAADYSQQVKVQAGIQSRTAQRFQRLQERGTTALFEAIGGQTVRSDGRPVRIRLNSVRMSGTPRLVAAPELSLNATRTARLRNTSDQPILPGTVALFADGAFIGNTDIGFVTAGEEFDLFAGIADDIRLTRTLDRSRSRIDRGRRTTEIAVAYVIDIDNLSDSPARLELADRIPVSHSKEIRVADVAITPPAQPDPDGLLLWHLDLAGESTQKLTISYTVEYPNDHAGDVSDNLKAQLRSLESQL